MTTVIEANGLTKRYGQKTVVDHVSLSIDAGRCFGLLGPNGAGKTTTLRMILGVTPPDAGTLHVLDHVIPDTAAQARKRIGVVPQTDNLDPDFTVVENLKVYGSYFGIDRQTLNTRIDELLGFVELNDVRDAVIETLSGGMKRRLSFARALINDPELIVLDEPTTGLDPQVRHIIWGKLRDLTRQGKTLLLTTHYMEEAQRLCDELVIIDHGRILEQGAPRALIEQHIAHDVVEVHGDTKAVRDRLKTNGECRIESVGHTLYIYTSNATALMNDIGDAATECLHRPANLEDVFLKLTGRELRE
ncbi:MAG: ATP-binding cassette domain-containing protein [Gammaproteobacteria bacterium]|nr:MAG: ATP-binding cassette domain-containing protein [Gammaproteobacteria bacterium]